MNEKYNAYVRSVANYFIEEMKKNGTVADGLG